VYGNIVSITTPSAPFIQQVPDVPLTPDQLEQQVYTFSEKTGDTPSDAREILEQHYNIKPGS
jgi:hypothetical protein